MQSFLLSWPGTWASSQDLWLAVSVLDIHEYVWNNHVGGLAPLKRTKLNIKFSTFPSDGHFNFSLFHLLQCRVPLCMNKATAKRIAQVIPVFAVREKRGSGSRWCRKLVWHKKLWKAMTMKWRWVFWVTTKYLLKLRKHISTHNCPQFMKTKIKTKKNSCLFFFSISDW